MFRVSLTFPPVVDFIVLSYHILSGSAEEPLLLRGFARICLSGSVDWTFCFRSCALLPFGSRYHAFRVRFHSACICSWHLLFPLVRRLQSADSLWWAQVFLLSNLSLQLLFVKFESVHFVWGPCHFSAPCDLLPPASSCQPLIEKDWPSHASSSRSPHPRRWYHWSQNGCTLDFLRIGDQSPQWQHFEPSTEIQPNSFMCRSNESSFWANWHSAPAIVPSSRKTLCLQMYFRRYLPWNLTYSLAVDTRAQILRRSVIFQRSWRPVGIAGGWVVEKRWPPGAYRYHLW